MAEGLLLPDGSAPAAVVDVENGEADFARMMAGASEGVSGPAENEPAAPPKREPREPSQPKRGRPTKDVRARTRDAKATDTKAGKAAALPPKDFRADLNAVGDGLWIAASSIPVAAPYAALVHLHQPSLVDAINQGAQVNPGVRNAVEKLTSGTGSAWALQLALVGANIAMQGWAIAKDPQLRQQLVESNAAQIQQYMAQIGAVPVADAV